MFITSAELPARDLRPWPTPRHTDIGGQVEVRVPDCTEQLIRLGLDRQTERGAEAPRIVTGTLDGESQTVMVVSFETTSCGRLTHRIGVWPPGSDGYETSLELPTPAEVMDDLRRGGDGTCPDDC